MTTDRALELAEAALHEQRRRDGSPDTIEALDVVGALREGTRGRSLVLALPIPEGES